ncbi:TIGR00725 family protein [Candidatus Margulisiibacteriota bacterium]
MERVISVIGESLTSLEVYAAAERVGQLLAENDITIVCGGLTGVMEAVCKGAKSKGGRTVGILPGNDRNSGNQYIDVPIVSGIGYARNSVVAKTGQVVIAIGGWFGTLCELAFALDAETPVIGLDTWDIYKDGERPEKGIIPVKTPEEAVETALKLLEERETQTHGE